MEVVRSDGKRIPALISGTPLFDPDSSELTGCLVLFADISQQVDAEKAVAQHAQELNALYETSLEINAQPDLPTLLTAIVRRASRLVNVQMGGLYLLHPDTAKLELVVAHNLPGQHEGTVLDLGEGLSGKAALDGAAIQVTDYSSWPGRANAYEDYSFRRTLAVPLRLGDSVIGVIDVTDADGTEPFTEDEVRLVSLFADQAAIAIENARLLEAERAAKIQAETLQKATEALGATLDTKEVLQLILQQLQLVVPYESCTVQQLRGATLEIIDGRGFSNLPALIGTQIDISSEDNPNGMVIRSRQPVILQDAPTKYREFLRPPHDQSPIRSWMGVPLLVGDRQIGVLSLDMSEPAFYRAEHAHLAMAFATQAATAVENSRLFSLEQRKAAESETLLAIAKAVGSSLNLPQVVETIARRTARSAAQIDVRYSSSMNLRES